jgi:hypothetical protein
LCIFSCNHLLSRVIKHVMGVAKSPTNPLLPGV